VSKIFSEFGLRVYDVEILDTHGGSLRIYGCHKEDPRRTTTNVDKVLRDELDFGLQTPDPYINFQHHVDEIKNNLLNFLKLQNKLGKKIVGYGAAAKGNTLLNYSGIKVDLLPKIYDAAISKQGKLMPGSHIPILPPNQLIADKPDYLLVLPWNIIDEIMQENAELRSSGVKFITAVPQIKIRL